MVNQRSKSGCWTCRLRRKKCPEDGVPCSNCTARAVVCHGYGPRPAWKDRGEREQEEVDRLQLRRRSHQARCRPPPPPELPPSSAEERLQDTPEAQQQQQQQQHRVEEATIGHLCLSPSLALLASSPVVAMAGLRPSPARRPDQDAEDAEDGEGEPYDFSAMLDPQLSLSGLHTPSGLWADGGLEGIFASTASPPPLFVDSAATTLNSQAEEVDLDGAPGPGEEMEYPVALRHPVIALSSAATHVNALHEREMELMMQFLGDDFERLHPCAARSWAVADRAWLLWLLHRSPTFFYTALSTSAYSEFLRTPPHDGRRAGYFREYDGFRNRAMELYCQLLDSRHPSMPWNTRETVICSVQLAMLESLGENLNATQTYLDAASDALAKLSEDLVYIGELSPSKSITSYIPMSGMERKTVEFFICTLIRTHTLHSSSHQTLSAAGSVYRRMLSPAMLGDAFLPVAGFHSWALVALMDAVDAAVWKQAQEAQHRLSMRELVGKAETILSTVEDQIRQEEHVPTLIFAYAVIIYIHTLASGHRPAVPEIHAALERAVPLWRGCSFRRQGLRSVAWAFCVSASLATGHHRRAFSGVLAEAATQSDESGTTAASLKALSEECWKVSDTGGTDCDWRVVMQRLKPSMQTMFV